MKPFLELGAMVGMPLQVSVAAATLADMSAIPLKRNTMIGLLIVAYKVMSDQLISFEDISKRIRMSVSRIHASESYVLAYLDWNVWICHEIYDEMYRKACPMMCCSTCNVCNRMHYVSEKCLENA